jgi:protein-L-isoaspartate(D-aspartate) O-methyltransferase
MQITALLRSRQGERDAMVQRQLAGRGVRDARVLAAMREVPRELFIPPPLAEFAYEDSALPIAEGQTISQPYIVAIMLEALELTPGDRLLDVGTGSGYAAAVASRIVSEVYTIERHRTLAEAAERSFSELGYENVHVRMGDGSLGWPEEAPFDAISVAAAGPTVPPELLKQLAPDGRLVIPTGPVHVQHLLRVRRTDDRLVEDRLGEVRFVPLIGAAAWPENGPQASSRPRTWLRGERGKRGAPADSGGGPLDGPTGAVRERVGEAGRTHGGTIPDLIGAAAEPFAGIEDAGLDGLLARIGDARVVLLGEATHGTSEFYRMRARITRELVEREGFRIVAIEGDWPDAARVDAWVRGYAPVQPELTPFARFPTWMWRNAEFAELVQWLRDFNKSRSEEDRVGVFGLDLYSLFGSLDAVLRYLDDVDPEAAATARARYGCLTPWSRDPASYGRAALSGRYRECERGVVATLADLLSRRVELEARDGQRFFDAERNARLIASAERYYRIMYYGASESWNLRDRHMFDTLLALLAQHAGARGIVWAHNSHLGDASATEMGVRGEHNVGQLAREHFGRSAYLVGFGTHTGTVAAASDWGRAMQVMHVTPSDERSYERLCHRTELPTFLLPLRGQGDDSLLEALTEARLERAIGVVYRPESELQSHYFHASLPEQFDEYVWFDRSEAVTPLSRRAGETPAETFPFGV